MRDVRVGVERYIRNSIAVGDKKILLCDVLLHHAQRAMAFLHPVFESVALQVASAFDQRQPEISSAEIRLQAVLLEEHPLQCLGAFDPIVGRQRRAAGDVPKNGVGFGEVAARRHFQQWHLPVWIFLQEIGCVAFAFQDVDLDQPVRRAELRQSEPHLVAISRALHRIECVHRFSQSAAEIPDATMQDDLCLERGDVVTGAIRRRRQRHFKIISEETCRIKPSAGRSEACCVAITE